MKDDNTKHKEELNKDMGKKASNRNPRNKKFL
jgi:hypothetical protein